MTAQLSEAFELPANSLPLLAPQTGNGLSLHLVQPETALADERWPKLHPEEAAYAIARGRLVGRIAACRALFSTVAPLEEFIAKKGFNVPVEPNSETLRSTIAELKAKLSRDDQRFRLQQGRRFNDEATEAERAVRVPFLIALSRGMQQLVELKANGPQPTAEPISEVLPSEPVAATIEPTAPIKPPAKPRQQARLQSQTSALDPPIADGYEELPEHRTVQDYMDVEAQVGDPVRQYFTEIGRHPLISAAEEVELSQDMEAGLFAEHLLNDAASLATFMEHTGQTDSEKLQTELVEMVARGQVSKQTLYLANLRLVVALAKRYKPNGLQFLDIVQEGNVGLMRAVEKFDYTKGNKFSTYATWWIRQTISRAIADTSRTVRLPAHMNVEINRLRKVERDMTTLLGHELTDAELAQEVGVSEQRLNDIRRFNRLPVSLDYSPQGDGEATIGELLSDTSDPEVSELATHSMLQRDVEHVLTNLTSQESLVIRLRFGLEDGKNWTLEEVGRHPELHVTRERIRQVEAKALLKLRRPDVTDALEGYLH